MNSRLSAAAIGLLLMSGCAAPPVHFYTLGPPSVALSTAALNPTTPVVVLDRITLPDYLDTQDMAVRSGNEIMRSANGRWAERLSEAATSLLAARLGESWPNTFVTTARQSSTPNARLSINVTRLDITQNGQGTLDADWTLVPADEHRDVSRARGVFTASGATTTDGGNVALTEQLLNALAQRIAQSVHP